MISIIFIILLLLVSFSLNYLLNHHNLSSSNKNKVSNNTSLKNIKTNSKERFKNKKESNKYEFQEKIQSNDYSTKKDIIALEKNLKCNTHIQKKAKKQNLSQKKFTNNLSTYNQEKTNFIDNTKQKNNHVTKKDDVNLSLISCSNIHNSVDTKKLLQERQTIIDIAEEASNFIEENTQLVGSIPSHLHDKVSIKLYREEFTEINKRRKDTLARLEIFPQQVQLLPNEEYKFEVIGYDFNSNKIDLDKVIWKSSKGGKINYQGVFKGGYTKNKVTIIAKTKNVESFAEVTLIPVVRDLEITPKNIILQQGKEQQFHCNAIDQYGNIINIDKKKIIWDAVGGKITSDGVLATDTGQDQTCIITAQYVSYSQTGNFYLFNLNISLKVLSYILSLNIFQYSLKEIIGDPDKTTNWLQATLEMLSGNGFNFDLQTWLIMQIIKLITKLLNVFIELLLNESIISKSVTFLVICKHKNTIPSIKREKKYLQENQFNSKQAASNNHIYNKEATKILEQEQIIKERENKQEAQFSFCEPSFNDYIYIDIYDIDYYNTLLKIVYPSSLINYDKLSEDNYKKSYFYEKYKYQELDIDLYEPIYDSYFHCPDYYEELLKDSYSYDEYL